MQFVGWQGAKLYRQAVWQAGWLAGWQAGWLAGWLAGSKKAKLYKSQYEFGARGDWHRQLTHSKYGAVDAPCECMHSGTVYTAPGPQKRQVNVQPRDESKPTQDNGLCPLWRTR